MARQSTHRFRYLGSKMVSDTDMTVYDKHLNPCVFLPALLVDHSVTQYMDAWLIDCWDS